MHSLLGKTSDISILEVLGFISQTGKTGELIVEEGNKRAGILLARGRIITGWRTGGGQLGELLLQRGTLDPGTLHEALRLQQTLDPPPPLGKILLECGAVSRADLEEALSDQIKEVLHTIISWPYSVFSFDVRELRAADSFVIAADIDLHTERILLDVVRVRDELAHYMEKRDEHNFDI